MVFYLERSRFRTSCSSRKPDSPIYSAIDEKGLTIASLSLEGSNLGDLAKHPPLALRFGEGIEAGVCLCIQCLVLQPVCSARLNLLQSNLKQQSRPSVALSLEI